MNTNETVELLERIAKALERIASSLDNQTNYTCPDTFVDEDSHTPEISVENPRNDAREAENIESIEDYLNGRNIQIKTVPPEETADKVINSLSEFLGKNYDSLRELLLNIKRAMQRGASITLSIKDYSQKDVSNVCQFATRLHEVAFLEKYKYFKSPQYLIRAKTTTLPIAQNFFSGKWLERFVLLSVQRAVDYVSKDLGMELEFSYFLNPQVILPNGDDFELDLFFYVSGFFYWIEAKSGDYQQHISKYAKISRILDLDVEHSIMVLTDIAPDKSAALSSLFSMSVLSLTQLEEAIIETLRKDIHS